MKVSRKQFINSIFATTTTIALAPSIIAASDKPIYKAAIIGRTGGGNYGHGYDLIFKDIENVEVVAIADQNPQGLEKAAIRSGALRKYSDFKEMLEKEKPDLVSIAPRHPDCHVEMAIAACEVARGISIEKPMAETVEDCDKILNAAQKRNVKIMVAHNRRWTKDFIKVKYLLKQGLIGEVREVIIHGKQDFRSGGEDLIVLGTHDFDLLRFYFGDPLWCFASIRANGKDITKADIRKGSEPILVAGDSINAMYGFNNNLVVNWASIKRNDHWNKDFSKVEKWAFEILGTKGIVFYQSGLDFKWIDSPFLLNSVGITCKELPEPDNFQLEPYQTHPIKSLIYSIENNTQPICSGYDGAWTIEMVSAAYQSQRSKKRIDLPLIDRKDPLRNWA